MWRTFDLGKWITNYGNGVSIYAPGGSGTDQNDANIKTIFTMNGSYHYFNGTSAAAPHVSGVAALMLSVNPEMTGFEGDTLGARLKTAILASADTVSITVPTSTEETTTQSVKKLNAYKAVKSLTSLMYNSINNGTAYEVSAYSSDISGDVVIPAAYNDLPVTKISYQGFAGCSKITNISIPASVTFIDASAFVGCTSLTTIEVDAANSYYSSSSGVLYNKNKTELICCPAAKSSYSILSSVTSIGDYALLIAALHISTFLKGLRILERMPLPIVPSLL